MKTFRLESKEIVITGGLGAIAQSILQILDAHGARLIVTDRKPEDEARDQLADWNLAHLPYYPMDITDPEAVEAALASVFGDHPGINVALGHAGGTVITPFAESDHKSFDDIVRFNFLGQTYFARGVLRHWTEHRIPGHLIFTSSYVSKIPMAGISAYVACKAALEMFMKNLALEYAVQGIRVNAVSPGNVAVGSSKRLYDTNDEYRDWVDRISPLGQRNSPESIANAFVYLCSDLADEVDGHVLQVDRGAGLPKLG